MDTWRHDHGEEWEQLLRDLRLLLVVDGSTPRATNSAVLGVIVSVLDSPAMGHRLDTFDQQKTKVKADVMLLQSGLRAVSEFLRMHDLHNFENLDKLQDATLRMLLVDLAVVCSALRMS